MRELLDSLQAYAAMFANEPDPKLSERELAEAGSEMLNLIDQVRELTGVWEDA